jgi:hypothetical protein
MIAGERQNRRTALHINGLDIYYHILPNLAQKLIHIIAGTRQVSLPPVDKRGLGAVGGCLTLGGYSTYPVMAAASARAACRERARGKGRFFEPHAGGPWAETSALSIARRAGNDYIRGGDLKGASVAIPARRHKAVGRHMSERGYGARGPRAGIWLTREWQWYDSMVGKIGRTSAGGYIPGMENFDKSDVV